MVSSLRNLRLPFRRLLDCSCVSLIVVALILFVTVLRHPRSDGKLSETFGLPETFGGLLVPSNALPEKELPAKNQVPPVKEVQSAKAVTQAKDVTPAKAVTQAKDVTPAKVVTPAKDVTPEKDVPKWCSELIQNPRPSGILWGKCHERGRYGVKCSDGKPRFFSQYSQDMLLYLYHFRHLKRAGTYADLATNEPVKISNTFFFDKCLRWRGLCVEPNPQYHDPIRERRSCSLETTCLSDRVHNVSFILAGGFGGISATNKNRLSNKQRIDLTCKTTAQGLADARITHIDYLSLDVEGHEEYVLRGINWNTTTINVISVELEANIAAAIRILEDKGFRRFDVGYLKKSVPGLKPKNDAIYLHERVVWGKPV